MSTKGSILLVDNNSSVTDSYPPFLKREGFDILVASNVNNALEILKSNTIHLVLSDVHLIDDNDPNDYSGIEFIKGIDLGIRRIFITGCQNDIPVELFNSLSKKQMHGMPITDGWIFKGDITTKGWKDTIEEINRIFREDVRINFDLDIYVDGKNSIDGLVKILLHHIRGIKESSYDEEKLSKEIIEVVQKLFYEEKRADIEILNVGGYSETVVIKVHATKEKSGLSIPVIIKIGLKDDILIEYSNYRDYVKPKTAAFRTARIEKNIALTKLLGGIEYTLIGDSAETIVTFKKYYQTHEWTSVSKSIKNVFRICEHWYKDREKREIINIVDAYQGYYKFSFDKLENEWLKKKTPDYFKHTTISFPNIKGDFINPVYWLINKGSFQIALYQCIVHGDLNSGNILVDKNSESWLIDFYSVGKSFILRDFIELETEVKFNLIEEMELDKILKFELLLLQNCSFEEKTGNLLKDIRRKELKKGFKTIQLIREHAGKAISPETNMKAYYVGLLMHTLSLLRFYQISKRRRHHMLLSASLICKKLDEWQNQKAFDSIIEINK